MATRTEDLTEAAKLVAEKLAARCGSLKRVLSAGVLALDALSAEEREVFMAKAYGMSKDELAAIEDEAAAQAESEADERKQKKHRPSKAS